MTDTADRVAMRFEEILYHKGWLIRPKLGEVAAVLSSHGLREAVQKTELVKWRLENWDFQDAELPLRLAKAVDGILTALLGEPPTVKGEK